ncbi:MAG: hypothetical protein IJB92_02265 [Clostridia bacterium]|nr:hypothetical protein [Clostridia bacterium]
MVHAEDTTLGCVCPKCNNRCTACLGTDSVISREKLKNLKDDPELLAYLEKRAKGSAE